MGKTKKVNPSHRTS